MLMGDQVEPRREFIEQNARHVASSSMSSGGGDESRPVTCSAAATSSRASSSRRCAPASSTTRCRSSSSRALPDVRDGLKPVHRRVLYAMCENGLGPTRPYVKCVAHRRRGDGQVSPARRLGDLRHARAPRAGLLAALPARRRAGELRLGRRRSRRPRCATPRRGSTRLARRCCATSTRTRSTSCPNYDGSEQEPLVLPARFPNLLVNGSAGHRRRDGDEHAAAQSGRGRSTRRSR